jgi:hypothetical protein
LKTGIADFISYKYFILAHWCARIIAVFIWRCLVGELMIDSSRLNS